MGVPYLSTVEMHNVGPDFLLLVDWGRSGCVRLKNLSFPIYLRKRTTTFPRSLRFTPGRLQHAGVAVDPRSLVSGEVGLHHVGSNCSSGGVMLLHPGPHLGIQDLQVLLQDHGFHHSLFSTDVIPHPLAK